MLEDGRVKHMVECRHARLHAVAEVAPWSPGDVMGGKNAHTCKALGVIAPKQLSHARKSEPTAGAFSEQAHARERPQ